MLVGKTTQNPGARICTRLAATYFAFERPSTHIMERRRSPKKPFFTSLFQQAINLYVISLIVEVHAGLEPHVTFAFVSLTLSLSQ